MPDSFSIPHPRRVTKKFNPARPSRTLGRPTFSKYIAVVGNQVDGVCETELAVSLTTKKTQFQFGPYAMLFASDQRRTTRHATRATESN